MNDNYSHEDNRIIYVVENIPGPSDDSDEYQELINNFNSQLTNHCKCKQNCLLETCECLKRGGETNYTAESSNGEFRLRLNNKTHPVMECNSLCHCSHTCSNRYVQHGPVENLIVKKCQEECKGLGLFTNIVIPKGTFISEYAGEVLTKSEAVIRQHLNREMKKMNYIYCLNEHCDIKKMQTFVDPSSFGNIGRYINHSCEPNCLILPVRVDTPIPKLAIFSTRDILPGTEITFDYGSNKCESNQCLLTEMERTLCLCKSETCKVWMPYEAY